MTSGLVGEMAFKVLPKVAPWVTVAVTALAMLVSATGLGHNRFSFPFLPSLFPPLPSAQSSESVGLEQSQAPMTS